MTFMPRFFVLIALLGIFATGCSRTTRNDVDASTDPSTDTGAAVIAVVDVRKFDANTTISVILENQGDSAATSLTVTVEPMSVDGQVLMTALIPLIDVDLSVGEDLAFILALSPTVDSHSDYNQLRYSFSWSERKTDSLFIQEL